MAKRYELKKSSDGQYFFTLHAENNETILTSEMYKAKVGAENGVASVKTNAENDFALRSQDIQGGQALLRA